MLGRVKRIFERHLRHRSSEPIRSAREPARASADTLAATSMVLIKEAIPLREAVSLSADAVDYYMWRKLPHGGGSIVCNVPDARPGAEVEISLALVKAVCLGFTGDVARRHFQRTRGTSDFIVPVLGLNLRLFTPDPDPNERLPLHQDGYVFPPQFEMLNGWTLLYPARVAEDEAAGLELIPAGLTELLEKEPHGTSPHAYLEPSYAVAGGLEKQHGRWAPPIELGDVMLFDKYALHRTYHDRPANKPRLAVEVRMIALEPVVLEVYAKNGQPYFMVKDGLITGPKRARLGEKSVEMLPV
jgi:hypothetical protein